MNEQQQAELLARWLEDGTGPPPEGLDAEVVESIVALKPELAPPPTLSADDILAGVRTGPLATLDIPLGASVGAPPEEAPPEGASARRRPWFMAIAGIGGISSLAAAALVVVGLGIGGLTLVNSAPAPEQEVASAPDAVQRAPSASAIDNDAVVGADTGLRADTKGRARKPNAAAKSRPKLDAAEKAPGGALLNRDQTPTPEEAVVDLEDFNDSLDAEPALEDEDAAARMIPEAEAKSERSFDEGVPTPDRAFEAPRPRPSPAPAPLAQTPSSMPAMEPSAPPPPPAMSEPREYADDGYGAGAGAVMQEEAADANVELDAELSEAAPEATGRRGGGILGSSKAKKEARREKERQKKDQGATGNAPASAPIPEVVEGAEMEENLAVGGSDSLAGGMDLQQAAAQNASSGATAESAAADRYIQAADYRAAIAVCDAALNQYTSTSRERQNLLRIKGNAHARLGEHAQAQEAWRAAIAVRDALDGN